MLASIVLVLAYIHVLLFQIAWTAGKVAAMKRAPEKASHSNQPVAVEAKRSVSASMAPNLKNV